MPFDWQDYLKITRALQLQAASGLPREAALQEAQLVIAILK